MRIHRNKTQFYKTALALSVIHSMPSQEESPLYSVFQSENKDIPYRNVETFNNVDTGDVIIGDNVVKDHHGSADEIAKRKKKRKAQRVAKRRQR